MTGAKNVIALNSGMAAISNTVMALAAQGKNIVTSKHLFGNTFSLLMSTLRKFGVGCKLADLTNAEAVESVINENTCCISDQVLSR